MPNNFFKKFVVNAIPKSKSKKAKHTKMPVNMKGMKAMLPSDKLMGKMKNG